MAPKATLLIKGTAVDYDGGELPFKAGMAERIAAEDALGVTAADLEAGRVGEKYIAFIAFKALQRVGTLPPDATFEQFVKNTAGVRVDSDPESEAPPAS